jgi:hypothetical protein
MMKRYGWILPLILVLVLLPMGVLAQHEHGAATPGAATGGSGGEMMKGHQGMHGMKHSKMMEGCMAMKDKMKTDFTAMDTKLDEKVAAMNAAKGEARSEAMAAVINEMVSQRKEMRAKMSEMHHAKMCHMMGTMKHGEMGMGHEDTGTEHGAHAGHGGEVKEEGAKQ